MPRRIKWLKKKMTSEITFSAIGRVNSPYKEKFAIPRQPGIVSCAKGSISLLNNANNAELVRGLEHFSHIWVIFVFHGTQSQGWKPLVRPPRLGGNKKLGVLATRSTFRPNPIGMSVVALDGISIDNNNVQLKISGLDLLDATPVLDIKPYIAYSDVVDNAQASYAQTSPKHALSVSFSANALAQLPLYRTQYPELKTLIKQVLMQDPRPAYKQQKQDDKLYGMRLYDLNIQWQMTSLTEVFVNDIDTFTS